MPRRETEFAGVSPQPSAPPQVLEATPERRLPGALRGERVVVIVETIKPDKRAEFQRLLHEVIAPAALRARGEAWARVRLLEPVAANPDGSWTYATLIDPAAKDVDYDRQHLLEGEYGREAADEFARSCSECRLGETSIHEMVQSAW
jgi:hypothetical protein